jgi:DNA-binding CsgD family transcriptional regulator
MPPSPRQLAALAACLEADSPKQAARAFGIGYDRMRHILHDLYRALGVHSQGEAVVRLDERFPGWRTTTSRRK